MKLLLFDKHLSKYLSYLGYIKLLPLLIACVPSVFVTSFGSAVASVTIPTLKGLIHWQTGASANTVLPASMLNAFPQNFVLVIPADATFVVHADVPSTSRRLRLQEYRCLD